MIKTSASQLKARLGKYMSAVKAGKEVVITDRTLPVARLIPFHDVVASSELEVFRARVLTAPPLGKVKVKGIALSNTDTLAMLRRDRAR